MALASSGERDPVRDVQSFMYTHLASSSPLMYSCENFSGDTLLVPLYFITCLEKVLRTGDYIHACRSDICSSRCLSTRLIPSLNISIVTYAATHFEVQRFKSGTSLDFGPSGWSLKRTPTIRCHLCKISTDQENCVFESHNYKEAHVIILRQWIGRTGLAVYRKRYCLLKMRLFLRAY
jgi:hypothetical protein